MARLTEVEQMLYKPDVLHSVFGGLILLGKQLLEVLWSLLAPLKRSERIRTAHTCGLPPRPGRRRLSYPSSRLSRIRVNRVMLVLKASDVASALTDLDTQLLRRHCRTQVALILKFTHADQRKATVTQTPSLIKEPL